MILGMSTESYTLLHVLISLVAIAIGFIVIFGLVNGNRRNRLTSIFLTTTALTSITGFGFPFEHILPAHIVGILSLLILAVAIPARYVFQLAGSWRWIYVVSSSVALYLNVFVLVVQSFQKIPALKALAPTQTEPPFLVAQLLVLLMFATLIVLATRRFHPERVPTA
ncbi:MAG TPA: hypothetical protein VH437_18080 [Terriglobales bacterium]|jgi:hypothetical protein